MFWNIKVAITTCKRRKARCVSKGDVEIEKKNPKTEFFFSTCGLLSGTMEQRSKNSFLKTFRQKYVVCSASSAVTYTLCCRTIWCQYIDVFLPNLYIYFISWYVAWMPVLFKYCKPGLTEECSGRGLTQGTVLLGFDPLAPLEAWLWMCFSFLETHCCAK